MATPEDQIRSLYEDFAKGEFTNFVAALDDDVLIRLNGPAPHAGEYKGKAASLEMLNTVGPLYEEERVVDLFVASGDSVVVLGTETLTVNATGKSDSGRYAHLWQVRDGRITLFEDFEMAGDGIWA